MGTSNMGSDLHSDKQAKQAKLLARKQELEQLLAAKNEELYKLCVQEVQLTGVMPLEAPLSPDVPQRERLGSVRSSRSTDGNDVHDGSDTSSRRLRYAQGDRLHDSDQNLRKNTSHRLSTPSISGLSSKSGHNVRHGMGRPETNSNFFPSPPLDRNADTFSIRTSHTYPALSRQMGHHEPSTSENIQIENHHLPMYKHHTMTTEYMNKLYYNNAPEAHTVTRLRETHFSSSHPDITSYTHGSVTPQQMYQQNGMRSIPILYQYASHLKAQNQHLAALGHQHQMQTQPKRRVENVRRNALQRTQTYHLTSHSDYNQHLEALSDNYRQPLPMYQHRSQTDIQDPSEKIHVPTERAIPVPNVLPLRERNIMRNPMHMQQLQVSTDDFDRRGYPDTLSPVSQTSGYSQGNFDSVSMKFSPLSQTDMKFKEKQWYETSLDSPTKVDFPALKSSPSAKWSNMPNSQAYEVMMPTGRHSAVQSPNQLLQSPPVLSPSGVSLESPKNLTVIEQGKVIPYREETKPFEMSDFYKYSTKFRQASVQKAPANNPLPVLGYKKMPMELPHYSQDQWHEPSN